MGVTTPPTVVYNPWWSLSVFPSSLSAHVPDVLSAIEYILIQKVHQSAWLEIV